MIAKKYSPFIFSFFMAFLMSCIMSLVITVFNVGFIDSLFFVWLKAWAFAFLAAFPSMLLVSPIANKLTARLTENNH